MRRVEHFNDPDAPAANSLVPAASAVVVDQAGRILLHRRNDNDLWSIPGGAMEACMSRSSRCRSRSSPRLSATATRAATPAC